MNDIKKYFKRKTMIKALLTIYAFLSICACTLMIDKLFSKEYSDISQYVSLNDSWDITINGRTYQNVSLDSFHFDLVNKGDTITMMTTLPRSLKRSENALLLKTRQCAVKIYVDADQIYQYGFDRINQGKTVGSGYLPVELPNNYAGNTLKISLIISENEAFTRFDPIRIFEWKNVYRVLLTENRISLFLGCFLTIFGVVVCCITIFALLFSHKYVRILYISLFSVCIGLWTLCYYNVILIFAMPLYAISLLEYLSLYLAPIPLILYMREDVFALKRPFIHAIYRLIFAIQVVSTAMALTLHSLDIVHCAAMLKYMQTLILCGLIYFVIVEFMNLRIRRQLVHKLFLIGMLILSACVCYDLVCYYLDRYRGMALLPIKGVSSVGMVIFIFLLLVSFYINLTQKMMKETERNFLIRSAYTDELTQINNRRYCMEYMNQITESENKCYTVFCFDLNNLKTVNDTYGHARGDILIKSAAEAISDAFGAHGIVARMGGDEFIAIAETVDENLIATLMQNFQSCIDRKNREIPELNMSIACGCASCGAEECNIEKIYQIADNRMYERKQEMKRSSAHALEPENASHSPRTV